MARDLSEIQPRCNAGIMISACSEITGHYSCGPLEVSSSVACVPVLFISNFLNMGEPLITLHMTRVFLSMINDRPATVDDSSEVVGDEEESLRAINIECARRCTNHLAELNHQSSELIKQVNAMKTSALRLRDSVIALVENEVTRVSGIIQLINSHRRPEAPPLESQDIVPPPTLDPTVFVDPINMNRTQRVLASKISEAFMIGGDDEVIHRCPTKDILTFIKRHCSGEKTSSSDKVARDVLKAIFLESVLKHGYILRISKKLETVA